MRTVGVVGNLLVISAFCLCSASIYYSEHSLPDRLGIEAILCGALGLFLSAVGNI